MEIKRFAAIDIGSNSVRLLIENVLQNGEGPIFKKSALIRVPVRLGANAFINHSIPEITVRQLVDAMIGFKHIMRANSVVHYKGCATSAMREATNGDQIIKRIKKEAGITIEIISGNSEAHIIFNSQKAVREKMAKKRSRSSTGTLLSFASCNTRSLKLNQLTSLFISLFFAITL